MGARKKLGPLLLVESVGGAAVSTQHCLYWARLSAVPVETPSLPTTSACWTDKMSSYPLGAFEIKGKIKYCVCKEIKAVGQDTVSLWVLPAWRRTWRLACVGTPVSSWFLSLLRFYGQTNELKYPHRDIAMRKFPDPEGTIEECAIQISLHILIIWFNFLLWNVSRTHTHAHTHKE